MNFKTCPSFKADSGDAESGTFEAIVSVFGNVDRIGDVVLPGAFSESLGKWAASGDPIPVLWSHRMDDPRFSIGALLEAAELEPGDKRIPEWADQQLKDNGGLWVRGSLHSGADATDVAIAARKLLRLRLVKQFSFAYDIDDGAPAERNGQQVYELRKLSLHEVSPTQVGCNDLTELLGAKAAAMASSVPKSDMGLAEVGRLVTSLGEDIREVIALLGKASACNDDERVTPDNESVKVEEPAKVKAEELARFDGATVRQLSEIQRLSLSLVD